MLSLLYVLISGIALPVGGVQMQYLWRNQLGDVYSLGLGSAACLGTAAATMSGWCSLTVGSFICTLICTIVCFFVTLKVSTQNLITFGILFGTFIGSLGTIVVTNAPNGDLLKQYYLWGAANFNLEGTLTECSVRTEFILDTADGLLTCHRLIICTIVVKFTI